MRSLIAYTGLVAALVAAGCGGSDQAPGDDGGGGSHDLSFPPGSDLAIPPGSDLAIPPGSDLAIPPGADLAGSPTHIQTVFIIMMENNNWSSIKGSSSAPYINTTLLPIASRAEQYYNPPSLHPSEPNYLWLEAGTNFGITADGLPSGDHQSTTSHLVTQLQNAGITWKSYQEDITAGTCPLTTVKEYAPKHNPMVYFDDVTNTNSASSANCIAHVRPFTELATDLSGGTVARYNFITPNLCDDMHGSDVTAGDFNCVIGITDLIKKADTWLSTTVPTILNSNAYKNGGVLFITWDEGSGSDGPIGFIALSPLAKGGGYNNSIHYTHSSTLKSIQEIFGVTPLLGGAGDAATTDLADLFTSFP